MNLYIVFIDLGNAYDVKIPGNWFGGSSIRRCTSVLYWYNDITKDIYEEVVARVRAVSRISSEFSITLPKEGRESLSFYLGYRWAEKKKSEWVPCYVMFADNIVIVDETRMS